MVFKAAGERTAREIVEVIEAEGGHLNAATGHDRTSFQVRALKGGLPNDLRAAPRVVAGDSQTPGWVMVGMQDGDLWLSRDFGDSFRRIATGLPALFGITAVEA